MPNVSACDWVMSALCAVLLIFNFHFRYAFRPCRSARPHSGVLGRYLSCTPRTFQGNYYDLILTVKMETRNYVEGYFGSEFRVTCNHCRVMAVWSRKTWKFVEEFLRFFRKKRPLMVKFSKFCSESFHRDIDRRCCVQISWNLADGKSEKSCVIFQTTKHEISTASQTFATAWIAPKICEGQPSTMYSECSRFHPNRFTFGGVTAERVNTAKLPHNVNSIFGWSLASKGIITRSSTFHRLCFFCLSDVYEIMHCCLQSMALRRRWRIALYRRCTAYL